MSQRNETGGGDAGERAKAIVNRWLGNTAHADLGYKELRKLIEAALRSSRREADELDDDVRRGGPEYFRAALKESRREGHREGAEAMREAAARQRDDRAADALDSGQPAIADLPVLCSKRHHASMVGEPPERHFALPC